MCLLLAGYFYLWLLLRSSNYIKIWLNPWPSLKIETTKSCFVPRMRTRNLPTNVICVFILNFYFLFVLMHFGFCFFILLQTIDDWSFDIFGLSESGNNQPIKYLGYDLLNRYGIFHKFKVSQTLIKCLNYVSWNISH